MTGAVISVPWVYLFFFLRGHSILRIRAIIRNQICLGETYVINYRESRFVRYVDLKLTGSKEVAALWDFLILKQTASRSEYKTRKGVC